MNLDPRIIAWEQHARRARTATSVLDLGAWIGLFAGMLFWSNFFWVIIAPTTIPEYALTLAIAAGYSVVLPMLISLLAPSTPAGMALAETRWRTLGHALSVASALFMIYHAFMVLWAWWASRPAAIKTQEDLSLAIGTAIVMIIVPALAWVQIAPDRWVAEIQQAQHVNRLKAAQQANLMAARLQYARAMALLKRGLANLTASEAQELAGTLIAMQRAENEAIGAVADSMRLLTGIDTNVPLLDDPQLLTHYEQLTAGMERLIAPINDRDYVELPPARSTVSDRAGEYAAAMSAQFADRERDAARALAAHQDTETGDRARARDQSTAGRDGPPRPMGAGDQSTAIDRWYPAAHRALRAGAWKRTDLEAALSISKTQANDLIRRWRDQGLLHDITTPANHYAWTEEA